MELALICDLIIALPKPSLVNRDQFRINTWDRGRQRLKRYVRKYQANFICMSGEMITAQQA